MKLYEIAVESLIGHGFHVGPGNMTIDYERTARIEYHNRICLLFMELDLRNGYAFNENIFVRPDVRSMGIGKRLNAARERICDQLGLTILINNNRNPKYWKRLGYRNLSLFQQIRLTNMLRIRFESKSMYKKLG
jgi:GNAT superfamily N-acetyltransferase